MNCHLYFYSKIYIALWNCLFHLVEVFLTPKFMFCFIIYSSPVIYVFWSMSDRNMVNNMMLLELDNFELWIWKSESTFLLYKEAPQFRSTKIEYSVRIISNSCQSWFPHGKKKGLCGSHGKESIHNAGDPGLIPGSARFPGEGNGNPLQYSCLGNPMERGAWQPIVHGVTKSQTRLSD